MNPGSVFFDEDFVFHDGETGEKLFIVLGSHEGISVVAKTTSQQHGRGTQYGCQPADRFQLKRKGVTYAQLVERLTAIGVDEKEVNIRNKLSRGKFTAAFFLQCLKAIDSQTLHLG